MAAREEKQTFSNPYANVSPKFSSLNPYRDERRRGFSLDLTNMRACSQVPPAAAGRPFSLQIEILVPVSASSHASVTCALAHSRLGAVSVEMRTELLCVFIAPSVWA